MAAAPQPQAPAPGAAPVPPPANIFARVVVMAAGNIVAGGNINVGSDDDVVASGQQRIDRFGRRSTAVIAVVAFLAGIATALFGVAAIVIGTIVLFAIVFGSAVLKHAAVGLLTAKTVGDTFVPTLFHSSLPGQVALAGKIAKSTALTMTLATAVGGTAYGVVLPVLPPHIRCARGSSHACVRASQDCRQRHDALCEASSLWQACQLGEASQCARAGDAFAQRVHSDEMAASCYQAGCAANDRGSCAALGEMYRGARFVRRDLGRAIDLFAADCHADGDRGCVDLDSLGYELDQGEDARTRDPALALRAFRQACAGRDAIGCYDLGMRLRYWTTPAQPAEAIAPFTTACEQGHTGACHQLGFMFEQGIGTPTDLRRALALYGEGCAARVNPHCEGVCEIGRSASCDGARRVQDALGDPSGP